MPRVSPDVFPDCVEVRQTDTSPRNTITVLQGALAAVRDDESEDVDETSSQSDHEVSVSK